MTEEKKEFTFYAFISYKHADMKWGRWIQKKLENYRLPRALCREYSLPRRLTPVFRDETDLLAGKPVHDNLLDKLAQSKFLIVICSRNMQHHPEYIDYEIRQFLSLGNPVSHILPVIVDGEGVAKDPANEAMPPALLAMGDQRPLGITMDPRRKTDVILKLVASMLQIEIETLRSRDQQRRQRIIITALTLGLCAALALGALMTWEFVSVKRAQLREQLTYAQTTYQAGDRYQAKAMVETVLAENPLILTDDITLQAKQLKTATSITPMTGSVAGLESASSDSYVIPCADEASFFIMSDNRAIRYDLEGRQTLNFSAGEAGSRLYAVSPDGRHALVLSYPTNELPASALWLWDMEANRQIACLTASNYFDMAKLTSGDFDNVTHGTFSPDGSLVCAYAANGYFSQNETLQVFSSETGEEVVSIPGELLIAGQENSNAAKSVEYFEFISDTLLHWKGPVNHVYYDMAAGQSSVVSVRDAHMVKEDGCEILHGRYAIAAGSDMVGIFDMASGANVWLDSPGTQAMITDGISVCGQYAIIPTQGVVKNVGVLQDLLIVDLASLTTSFCLSEAYPEVCGKYASLNVMIMEESGRVYAYLSDGMSTGSRLSLPLEDRFICLDCHDGTVSRVSNLSYKWLENGIVSLGSRGDVDWIIANADGQARLLRVSSQNQYEFTDSVRTVQSYLLDTLFADAVQSFDLVGSEGFPRLISNRNNEYFLSSLERPGVQLDTGLDMDASCISHTAASADGSILLKAQGKTAALWRSGALVWSVSLEHTASSVCLSSDGQLALIAAGSTAYVHDAASGSLLHRHDTDPAETILHAKLSDDGETALLAVAPDYRSGEKQMRLFALPTDGCGRAYLLTEYVYYPTVGDVRFVYDLSGDGLYTAVIEYLPVGSHFQRAVTVYDTASGALLARTPVSGYNNACPTLDVSAYYSSAVAFDFLSFGDDKTLMAGLFNGVWLFDMETMTTRCFIPDGSEIEGLPLLKDGQAVLYPAGGLHAWDAGRKTLLGTVSMNTLANARMNAQDAFASGEITLSADGSLLTIAGVNKTLLVDTSSWQVLGSAAASAVHVVYLDHSRFVYETGRGLYELIY